MRRSAFLLLFALGACDLTGPSIPQTNVERDDAWWEAQYEQADMRMSAWFCGTDKADGQRYRKKGIQCEADPGMPPLDVLRKRIVALKEQDPQGQTCTCNHTDGPGGSSTIMIPADKWDSGCVPHELLHASLYHMRHRCKSLIEHDDHYSVSDCRE